MKNLETLGVQEMNAVEMKETDGGCIASLLVVVAVSALVGLVAGCLTYASTH